jgi:hypothetical protein
MIKGSADLKRPRRLTRRELLSAATLAIPLLSVQFVPSFFLYIGIGSSLAAGTAAAVIGILFVYFATWAVSARYPDARRRPFEFGPFVIAAACVLLVIPHAAIAEYFQSI